MKKLNVGYLTINQLKKKGFKNVGKNCMISNKISTYNLSCILGDNVRIDDDVQLKGKIELKSNVHLARGCTLSGGSHGIFIDEFTSLANFVQIYSESDDYFNPSIPVATLSLILRKKFSKIYSKKILIGKCCLVGSLTIILPGTIIHDYSSVGGLMIINKKIPRGFYYSKKGLRRRKIIKFIELYSKIKKYLK
jgi:acetyltransferase-like isoleucine patch superfamily enzyme